MLSFALLSLTAFLCSIFRLLYFFRVFSTISSEKRWSFDCIRSFFAYLTSRAFDLLIEDGISRDFEDDLADISTVLFNNEAAWERTMFVAWSRMVMDALEEELSQESRKCASCEDTMFSYSSKDPSVHIILCLEWSSLGATIFLEVSGAEAGLGGIFETDRRRSWWESTSGLTCLQQILKSLYWWQ